MLVRCRQLARVRDTVSETQIGLMRLQFWSDAVDKTFSGSPPEQPVAAELHKVLIHVHFFFTVYPMYREAHQLQKESIRKSDAINTR